MQYMVAEKNTKNIQKCLLIIEYIRQCSVTQRFMNVYCRVVVIFTNLHTLYYEIKYIHIENKIKTFK